jgi:hypothetical protein
MRAIPHSLVTSATVAALLIAALPAPEAAAAERIHRCIGSGGEIAFSDVPCTAMDASPAGSVLLNDAPPRKAADPAGPGGTPAFPGPTGACATSQQDLRGRIAAAVAARDANALAGMLRWRGVGARVADRRLHELRELVRRPLLAIDRDAYDIADTGADEPVAYADDSLRVRTGAGDAGGVREHRFGIEPADGCYWLSW